MHYSETTDFTALRANRFFGLPAHCQQCGDWIVAPLLSEFVEGGEIRHHWVCDSCGETACTTILLNGE